jgi:hypothetical protein
MIFRGHNQRLEFLGDTVLQLIASEYLFKHFPEHHEGHLSVSSNVPHKVFCGPCGSLPDYFDPLLHFNTILKNISKHFSKNCPKKSFEKNWPIIAFSGCD